MDRGNKSSTLSRFWRKKKGNKTKDKEYKSTLPAKPCASASISSTFSEEEEHQRFFFTRRDTRRIRTLKSLHLLPRTPSSVTYAEIGIQVIVQPDPVSVETLRHQIKDIVDVTLKNFDDVKDSRKNMKELGGILDQFTSRLKTYERALEEIEERNTELVKQFEEKEAENKELNVTKEGLVTMLQYWQSQAKTTDHAKNESEKEKQHLLLTVQDLELESERLSLDVAFLTEEKVDLETSLNEHIGLLGLVTLEKEEAQTKEEELKTSLLQTKIDSAEQVGKYLDEMNAVWAEKRSFIKQKLDGKDVPKDLRKVLSSTSRNIEVEEERNRLVDQVELLSTQAVFQDLLIEQFQQQLVRLVRIQNGAEASDHKAVHFTDELKKAKKLLENESLLLSAVGEGTKKKSALGGRKSMSLPVSPLKAADRYWSTGNLVIKSPKDKGPSMESKSVEHAKVTKDIRHKKKSHTADKAKSTETSSTKARTFKLNTKAAKRAILQ